MTTRRGSWLLFAGGFLVNVDTLVAIDAKGGLTTWEQFNSSVRDAVHAYLASRAVAVRDPVGESIRPHLAPEPWDFDPAAAELGL